MLASENAKKQSLFNTWHHPTKQSFWTATPLLVGSNRCLHYKNLLLALFFACRLCANSSKLGNTRPPAGIRLLIVNRTWTYTKALNQIQQKWELLRLYQAG
jgi:hypothetical protein